MQISFSRLSVLVALCALSAPVVCLAQGRMMPGGAEGGQAGGAGAGAATLDAFGRPMSGQIPPELAPFDALIPALLHKYDVPGCTVAVMNDDGLVMSRGYGWADRDAKTPVLPDAVFRIGALSQTVTSAAILTLVQDGKLKLDAPVFEILSDAAPLDGQTRDPRLAKITVRQLLRNSGGWDAGASFDPLDRLKEIAEATGQPSPPDASAVVRYMMGQPLQFDPGTKSVGSGFGFLLLGRVIEKVSGTGYEDYVNAHLFTPIGATSFRLGGTREQERAPAETHYYDFKNAPQVASLFDANAFVARPNGGIALESRGASDGWVCSAPDFLKFVGAIDGITTQPDVLSVESLVELAHRPPDNLKAEVYAGLGWTIRPSKPYDARFPTDHAPEVLGAWWHEGALPGTSAFVGRDPQGRAWVALFNSHPNEKAWSTDMISALDDAISQSQWPEPGAPNGGGDQNGGTQNDN